MVAVVSLLLVVAGGWAQVPRPVAVDVGPVRALVPALEMPEGRWLSLKGVAAALGWQLEASENGDFVLRSEQGAEGLRFETALPGVVQGPGGFAGLGGEAARVDGDLFVPPGAVALIERLAHENGPPAGAWRLGLEANPESGGLTLTVEAPGEPDPEPREEILPGRNSSGLHWDEPSGAWTSKLPWPGAAAPETPWDSQSIGHPILEAIRLSPAGGAGLRLDLVPGPSWGGAAVRRLPEGRGWAVAMFSGFGRGNDAPGLWAPSARSEADDEATRRIVLDPGHGGEEEGAVGARGVVEKELVLDVARRTRAKLRMRGYEVVLTREGDQGLALDARAGIANNARADLFVSIHANASRFRQARGAETYILAAEATDDEARTAAALENNASRARLPGRIDGDLPLILWDMAQTEYLGESQRLAELIQGQLNARVNAENRGVRQAPFRVLVGATCPAVLVELGFLTHPEEEALLAQPAYRDRLATALAEAIDAYARARDGSSMPGFAAERVP